MSTRMTTFRAMGGRLVHPERRVRVGRVVHSRDGYSIRYTRVGRRSRGHHGVAPPCAAIERLGVVLEGRIRNDRVLRDGTVTDTAQYSLTGEQWPAVEAHLRHLLRRDT